MHDAHTSPIHIYDMDIRVTPTLEYIHMAATHTCGCNYEIKRVGMLSEHVVELGPRQQKAIGERE